MLGVVLGVAGCRSRREAGDDRVNGPSTATATATTSAELPPAPPAAEERKGEREALFDAIAREDGIDDPRVLAALKRVPRHRFVPEAWQGQAYANQPLPIGQGQTISQPAVVAVMTEVVEPKATDKCLEIGTGSGYQGAVLAELCSKVWSIEYVPELARSAERNLRGAGYGPERIELRTGDGYRGWPEAAPFDVIVITAALEKVPEPLLDQLAVGGRLVVPLGGEREVQQLELWRRKQPGSGEQAFERKRLMGVRFVPFVGEAQKR